MAKIEYRKLNELFSERDARYQELLNTESQNGKRKSDIEILESKFVAYQKANDEFINKLLRTMHHIQ